MDCKLPTCTVSQEVPPHTQTARVLTQLERPEYSLGISDPPNFTPERRSSTRFPLELSAELAAGKLKLQARTANISSGGLLLYCDQEVEIGTLVTVRLTWPIPQRNKQMVLVVHGEIIRRELRSVAIRHRRYEFEIAPQPRASRLPFSWQHPFTSLSLALSAPYIPAVVEELA